MSPPSEWQVWTCVKSKSDSPALLRDSQCATSIRTITYDARKHSPSHLFQMPRSMAQNLPVSRKNSTTVLDSVGRSCRKTGDEDRGQTEGFPAFRRLGQARGNSPSVP